MNEKEFIGQQKSIMLFKDEHFGGVRTLIRLMTELNDKREGKPKL